MRVEVAVSTTCDALFASAALERLKMEAPDLELVLCLRDARASGFFEQLWFIDGVVEESTSSPLFLTPNIQAANMAELQVREILARERADLVQYLAATKGMTVDEVELRYSEKLPKVPPFEAPPHWHVSQWYSYVVSAALNVNAILASPAVSVPCTNKIRKMGRSKLWDLKHKRPFVLVGADARDVVQELRSGLKGYGKLELLYEDEIEPTLTELVGMVALEECKAVVTCGGEAGIVAGAVGLGDILYHARDMDVDLVRWIGIPGERCRYFFSKARSA